MKKFLFLVFIVAVLFSCTNNQPAELDEKQKASIEQEVLEIVKNTVSNLNTLNMDLWSEAWNENEMITASIAIDTVIHHFNSFNEFKDAVSNWWSMREYQNIEIKQVDVEVLAENLVLITEIVNWDIVFRSGFRGNGETLVTRLWKKGDTGWKTIYIHESVVK